MIGVLGLLVREHSSIINVDRSIEPWGLEHADHFARSTLDFVTKFGGSGLLYPIMIGVASPLHLVIAGFALYEAWKLNRRTAVTITGPHAISHSSVRTTGA